MKGNCNITKDLLPLYIEEICSEDSLKYVDEHLQECEECRKTCALLKKTELTDLATVKQEINALKKLKKSITEKILYLYLLCIITIVVIVFLLMVHVNTLTNYVCFFLMPLTMLITCAAFSQQTSPTSLSLRWKWLFAVQSILILYSIVLMFVVMESALFASPPPCMPLVKTGPFLATQFTIISTASLVLLIVHLYQATMKKGCYTPISNVSILCIFLNLNYHSMLYGMDSADTFINAMEEDTLILLSIGIFTIVFLWFTERKLSQKKRLPESL